MVADSRTAEFNREYDALMRRFLTLLSFAAYLIAEILATEALATLIGWPGVLLLAAVTFVAGMVVMRRAGSAAFTALRRASTVPATTAAPAAREASVSVGDAGLLFLGGLLLVLPGVLADLAGVLLVVRPTRVLIRGALAVRAARWFGVNGFATTEYSTNQFAPGTGDVIEGEVIDRSDEGP